MKYSSNEDRSNTLNPNNDACRAAQKNRYSQYGTNVWRNIIYVCDSTADRVCHRITEIQELEQFIGTKSVLRSGSDCAHEDPNCLCIVDFPKTVEMLYGFHLDIGDKYDFHKYMVMKTK